MVYILSDFVNGDDSIADIFEVGMDLGVGIHANGKIRTEFGSILSAKGNTVYAVTILMEPDAG